MPPTVIQNPVSLGKTDGPGNDGAARPQLLRALGLRDGIALQIGMIIGSGIFVVPAMIAGQLRATGPILLVWLVGGALVLFGSLTLAELSAILPQAGGPYVYLRRGFGPLWAFLYTWNHFFINAAGSIAAIAVAFATYLGAFIPGLTPDRHLFAVSFPIFGRTETIAVGWIQITAIAAIALLTWVNRRGVKLGGLVMSVFTSAKILALVGLIAAAALSGKGSASHFLPFWPASGGGSLLAAFGLSMISVLWAYDGWIAVTLTAGEIKNPQRNVPLSLIIGTLTVIALYIGANLAFAYILPLEVMAASPRVAADVARAVLGPFGATLVIIGILCSAFGTINGSILSNPRAIYAAGADGTFARAFGRVHPRYRTPSVAILTMGIWGSVLTLSGKYEQIISYVVFGSWFFYALTALSVIVLRRKMPDAPRPYKAWGYPYATLALVAVTGWFLANTLIKDTRNAVIGIGLLLLSLPYYAFEASRTKRRAAARAEQRT
jgi:APA family basic amino acid/polyamine antiporter